MANLLINPSFDEPPFGGAAVQATQRPPWVTGSAAPANRVEVWRTPFTASVPGLLPYPNGSQYLIEMDSLPGFIEQVFNVPTAAGRIDWHYYHHRRNASDRIQLRVGDASQPFASNDIVDDHTATNNIWNQRQGSWPKPAGVTQVRFRLQQISPIASTGSLIDEAFAEFVAHGDPIETCECCPTGMTACWDDGFGPTRQAIGLLQDGQVIWTDSDGNEVDPSLITDCLTPVTVTSLPHPDNWPLALTGARRNKWTQTDAPPNINGLVSGQGSCRDAQNRYVHGPCAGNPGTGGNWVLQVNDINDANLGWNDGSGAVWASVEGWALIPLNVDPVPLSMRYLGGANNRALETGTEPANRVLRQEAFSSGPTFNQSIARCACLGLHGFGFVYIRGMSADGYNLGSAILGYDIGGGEVQIPRNRIIPADANHQTPTDPRTFCADVLPQFFVTENALQNPDTGELFELDGVTPFVPNGACMSVNPA